MEAVIHLIGALLVILTLVPALAHALELPGKRRLEPSEYVSVQRIYYPGFTVLGAAEPLAIAAMLASALLTAGGMDVWLRWFAVFAVATAHAVYWIRIHRINRVWLRDERLTTAGSAFFGSGPRAEADEASFARNRRQWEHDHVTRAVLAGAATVAVLIALV